MMRNRLGSVVFTLVVAAVMLLCVTVAGAEVIPFDSGRWKYDPGAANVEEYLGRTSLFVKGGIAYVADVEFTNGVIEFDVALPDDRGFIGGVFRLTDAYNYEDFYMRPHQSGKPDATQYTPVFNDLAGWQLYHGDGYSANVTYDYDTWIHLKIVVSGETAEVFIGDGDQPALVVNELKFGVRSGKVGVKATAGFAPAHFSGFSVTAMDDPPMTGKPAPAKPAEPGTIMAWEVSNAFDFARIDGITRLPEDLKGDFTWSRLECESTGLANIARLRTIGEGANAVFARVSIESDRDQTTVLLVGFSDVAVVCLNDNVLYVGNNTYRSRDYRYLGTIGFFDSVYLHLKKGNNELWIAVGENFGGWGLQARFEDASGIRVNE
jgi:hypothetical protein